MSLRWFFSRAVRQATEMRKHVWKILSAQRDLLAPNAIDAVEAAMDELQTAARTGAKKEALRKQMGQLETAANKWLKPYPYAGIRENVEVFLVAVAVAMAIRTFFLQPFKIPTGSMQPTLYGITQEDLRNNPQFKIPTGLSAFVDSWVRGISYYHVVAQADGVLRIGEPQTILPFVKRQRLYVGGTSHSVWFPPEDLPRRANLRDGQLIHQGEDIIKLKVKTGDHLFVDRLTYNFRRPTRGEIIVFETKGIWALPQDQFYIKRLVALGDETIQIGNDRHLIIDGVKLDAATPHFENVYTFKGPPKESVYSGHVNNSILGGYAPNFPDEQAKFTVRKNHYLVMGDNTLNSSDGRYWGDFSQANVIGKYFFVYWPILDEPSKPSRFGWGQR